MKRFSLIPMLACCLAGGMAQAQQTITVPGLLKFEAYTNITGTAVDLLTADPNYPASPGETLYMTSFDTRTVYPNDSHENYGGRVTALITPTETADYEFFLRSDDAGQLLLSSDETEGNLAEIAVETGCCDAFHESGDPETSAPIRLTAGKRYLIRAIYKEGGGGDYCQVAWRKAGDTTPAALLKPIPGAFLSALTPAGGTIGVTKQPASQSVAHNSFLTLELAATSSVAPLVIQWQKNGASLAGVTGPKVVLGPIPATDNGAKFKAVLSAPGVTINSDEVTVTVTADLTPPTVVTVSGSESLEHAFVDFSEAVTPATAGLAANYSIEGLNVTAAEIINSKRVKLTTARQTQGTTYKLIPRNITDTAGLVILQGIVSTFQAFDFLTGGLKFEAYYDIAGTPIQALLDSPKFPASPDFVGYATEFSSRGVFTDNSRENYGGRLSGWIVPTRSGDFEFFIRSDDAGELRLSPDEKPENAVKIAEETGCCGAFEEPGVPETSTPQPLVAGKRYYIEALWKEGGGGDYCDVAWRLAGDATVPRTLGYIPGAVLQSLAAPGTFTPATVSISSPAAGSNFDSGVPVTLVATATAAGAKTIARVEFFELTRKLGEVTEAPYSFTVNGLTDDVHVFRVRATDNAGIIVESAPLSITVGSLRQKITLLAIDDKTKWKYDRSGQDLSETARARNFNDNAWPSGAALIADETTTTVEPIRTPISRFNDEGTYVKTFYFRTKFDFPSDVGPGVKLSLRHVVDDGAVFYLNGKEVHRFGIAADVVVDASTDGAGHENIYEGPFDISVESLVKGENVLMAEVHQSGGSSSDMVFGAELQATIPLKIVSAAVVKIDDTTEWRYDRSGHELQTEWRQPSFNDSAWPKGKALIADETTTTVEPIRTPISRFNDEGTYVKTFYFRTKFNLASTNGAKLKLRHVVDDGAVFYLNGREIHRFGIGADVVVDSTTDAAGHENVYEGPFDIALDGLRVGENVLAAEVHQSGGSSSDMVFGAELTATTLEFDPSGAVVTDPPKFASIAVRAGQVEIIWTGGGKLEASSEINGAWGEVSRSSPYSAPAADLRRFFRLRQ